MALPTRPKPPSREEILNRRRAAEEEALLREVDDAVRQDDMVNFGRRFGWSIGIATVLLIAGFGGYLFWQHERNAAREANSEAIVTALDQTKAGNDEDAAAKLTPVVDKGGPAARSSARLMLAGLAAQKGQTKQAADYFSAVIADGDAPQPMRDLARVRLVAMQFDSMDKAKVVKELAGLAEPDSPFFGAAGELVAMAYLEQGQKQQAGALFAAIAKSKSVPESLRSRSRQMAGVLGVDAIVDPKSLLQQQQDNAAPGGA